MEQAATAPPHADGRHNRSWKNLLLDKHFQLKYTAYLVGIALLLSTTLGFILWRTSEAVISQSEHTVKQGAQVVSQGREVVGESKKVSDVVKMNIVKEYKDEPDLLAVFQEEASKRDGVLEKQQADLESQATALEQQSQDIKSQQKTVGTALVAVLTLLVILIGMAGILVTHKIAGPIFKMKRQIREVGEGNLRIPGKLRKGDELVHFFETFDNMVRALRARQEHEIELLDAALAKIESKVDREDLAPIYEVRAEMQDALDA